jgi:uncharacterized protein YegL
MRRRKTPLEIFSLSFLDCICCGLGAVLIVLLLYVQAMRRQENTVPALRAHASALSNDIVNLNSRIATLSRAEGSYTNTIMAISNAWMGLVVQYAQLSDELKLAQDRSRILGDLGGTIKEQLNLIQSLSNELLQAKTTRTILGIPIVQTRLLFLIDASLSMQDDQRLADVKGAFKVMLASLNETYAVDLVWFTTRSSQDRTAVYTPLWGSLQPATAARKTDAARFVTTLQPIGGTPTTTAVCKALKEYGDAAAIVLLSDGEPTDHDNWTECAADIKSANVHERPIYTVGVGSQMSNVSGAARQFMERVARESGGACISF